MYHAIMWFSLQSNVKNLSEQSIYLKDLKLNFLRLLKDVNKVEKNFNKIPWIDALYL